MKTQSTQNGVRCFSTKVQMTYKNNSGVTDSRGCRLQKGHRRSSLHYWGALRRKATPTPKGVASAAQTGKERQVAPCQ